jgi:hypothetical protein
MIRRLCLPALWLVLVACSSADEGRVPPATSFFYPSGVAADATGSLLFVTNGNTDLRFNGGSVTVVDFKQAINLYSTEACDETDPIDRRIPVCTEQQTILGDRTVGIGSFAGQPVVQHYLRPRQDPQGTVGACRSADPAVRGSPCHLEQALPTGCAVCVPRFDVDLLAGSRLLVPVRGDPSLTWINISADGHLDCGQQSSSVSRCDTRHRITQLYQDPRVVLNPEPFGLAVSDEMAIAMTTHLSAAAAGLFYLGDNANVDPKLIDLRLGVFQPNQNGLRAAFGVDLRPVDPAQLPPACEGLVGCTLGDFSQFFVTSRTSPSVAEVLARGADLCRPGLADDTCAANEPPALSLVPGPIVRLDAYLIDGTDGRDLRFTRNGNRAYAVNRRPPSVVEIDTSPYPPPAGDPRGVVLNGYEVCSDPSFLALRDAPDPLRVYVTCFAAGQVFVIDPPRGEVIDAIDVGRGPNGMVLVPGLTLQVVDEPAPAKHLLGVVVNFADNDLSVVDLEAGSRTENTVLFKIGLPRQLNK